MRVAASVVVCVLSVTFAAFADSDQQSGPPQNTYPVLDYTDFDENLDFTPNKRIPLKLLKQLQGIETVDDLFDKLIEPGQRYKRRSVKSTFESVKRIGRRLRKSGKTLRNITESGDVDATAEGHAEPGPAFDKRAFCHPRRVPVNVPQPSDPTLIYQPMCIQIERCGGCCAHQLFECVPLVKRNATRKVAVLRYPRPGAEYFTFEVEAKVKVERHSKCKCQCKIQPEDCTPHQSYDKQSCRCTCPEEGNHSKCRHPQMWSDRECRCRCQDYSECSTGTYFDTRMCRCRSAGEILALSKLFRSPLGRSYA